ncbi:hypothetical protein JW848_06740 [Candidatus Bipolaricaulota bacterium]|nr:hypothetical protein [Candidatus Bipolaricaulota bacterium]
MASQTLVDASLFALLAEWGTLEDVACILVAPIDQPEAIAGKAFATSSRIRTRMDLMP